MTIYEQKDKITAYGSASFKDWSNCDSESVKYKLYCNFGTVNEINGTVIQADGINIDCIKTMVPLIETNEMSKVYLICQIRDENNNILANSNVKALKSPVILFDSVNMVSEYFKKRTVAYGDIHYIWSDCYHSSTVVRMLCEFFDIIPTIDSFYSINVEVDCDNTHVYLFNEGNKPYLGCILLDEHMRYAFNYSELPRLDVTDLTNATYDYNNNMVNGYVNKGNVKYNMWKNCMIKSSTYKLLCGYHPNEVIGIDPSKFIDINCNGNDLDVVSNKYYNHFSCVIVRPDKDNQIVNIYSKTLLEVHHNDIQIYTRTPVCNSDVNNNNLIVKGSDLINCNDFANDELYYVCDSYKIPPTSMGLFNLELGQKYLCKHIELDKVITNGDRSYGCLIYNNDIKTQLELFALEAPSFNMDDVKFSFDLDSNKYVAKGNVKYVWSCENTNDKIFFECKMFDEKPKYDEFDKSSTTAINCTGTYIHIESFDLNMRYLGCEIYNTDFYTATSIRYIDLPSIYIYIFTLYYNIICRNEYVNCSNLFKECIR